MKEYRLSISERATIAELVDHLSANFGSTVQPEFIEMAGLYAHHLPMGLKLFLNSYRNRDTLGICKISGFDMNDDAIGPTPAHWNSEISSDSASHAIRKAEIYLVLLNSILGDVFSFSNHLQSDRLVHNILPIPGYEGSGLAFGSTHELLWHTEDAYYDFRADYLSLLCMRNDEKTPTTYTSMADLVLDPQLKDILFQNRFIIQPDNTHRVESADLKKAKQISILFGAQEAPYLRIDPGFTFGTDPEAQNALDVFSDLISAHKSLALLKPGEVCVIDNFRCVHGRKPFQPKYNGRDRWLKRVFVARDLRKSRALRSSNESRWIRELA